MIKKTVKNLLLILVISIFVYNLPIIFSFNIKTDVDTYAQIYYKKNENNYSENNSKRINLKSSKKQHFLILLPNNITGLRIDPCETNCNFLLTDSRINNLFIINYTDILEYMFPLQYIKNFNFDKTKIVGESIGIDPSIEIINFGFRNRKYEFLLKLILIILLFLIFKKIINFLFLHKTKIFGYFLNTNKRGYLYILVLLIIFIHNIFYPNIGLPGDSGDYWNHSFDFIKNGFFSLTSYDYPLRGYVFPLLLLPIRFISTYLNLDYFLMIRLFLSFIFSLSFVYIVPIFFSLLFNIKIKNFSILIFSFLVYLFWNGYFVYPLTDFFSFFILLLGFTFLFKFFKNGKYFYLLLTGFFISFSFILRPIYQIVIFPILLYLIFLSFKKGLYIIIKNIIVFFVGSFLLLFPQIYINFINYGTLSPFVQTKEFMGDKDLFLTQIVSGTVFHRHECALAVDSLGVSVFQKNNINAFEYLNNGSLYYSSPNINSYLGFFKIIFVNIFDFIFIYLRHFINGLDSFHVDLYYCVTPIRNQVHSFLNTIFLFSFLVTLPLIRKIINKKIVFVFLIIILPVLATIPTMIETRFFIPLHLIIYGIFSFLIIPKIKNIKFKFKYLILCLLLMLIFIIISRIGFNDFYGIKPPGIGNNMTLFKLINP